MIRSIRAATPNDVDRIAEVHVRSWQAAYADIFPAEYLSNLTVAERRDQWRARFDADPPPTVLVAEDEREIVGWASVGLSRDQDSDGLVGEVYGLYVDPPSWGRGTGGSLWSAAISVGVAAGWTRLIVWVLEENRRARRFYENVGLALEPSRRRLYRRDGQTAQSVRYALALPEAKPGVV